MPERDFEPLIRKGMDLEKSLSDIGGKPPAEPSARKQQILDVIKRYGIKLDEYIIQMTEYNKMYKICFEQNINDVYERNRCIIDNLDNQIKKTKNVGIKENAKKWKRILEEINKKEYGLYEQIERMKVLINY